MYCFSHFVQCIKYITLYITHVSLGIGGVFLCVCELKKLFTLCNLGQYVHLPNLVHTGGVCFDGLMVVLVGI